ncbi:MAG: cadmium-translocating P-type ATPase [Geminicoccaceae bacterium]|nr:MAG: cadmium-translocating P-type ATPase [Geminicoccaceae bacterium]
MTAAALARAGDAPPADLDAVDGYVDRTGSECRLTLLVEGLACGGCVQKIERALQQQPGVTAARVNLTTRRLHLTWDGTPLDAGALLAPAAKLGYRFVPFEQARDDDADERERRALLRAMAIAGFATANIMLLSVSVWAGHAQGMEASTRDLLHWFSALIAMPAVALAGQPFFRSAWQALKHGHTNMDVPISLAVVLAPAVSLFETMRGGPHAYFDSAVMLLFFLLIGRYLDRQARGRARQAATRLLALGARAVTVVGDDGHKRALPPRLVRPGMRVFVAAGERIGVDGRVESGASELDTSLITGESLPQEVGPGADVFAGTLNLNAPLTLTVTRAGDDTLLAEVVRLMEVAERQKGRFVGIAERMSRWYAPVVHLLALAAFLVWWLLIGISGPEALMIAVAVLIITCPCALGLAVPAVQVIASERLLQNGILLKAATALERLAEVDHVVFDKTGTLTRGQPELLDAASFDPTILRRAASLAQQSHHPLARALARAAGDVAPLPVAAVVETPGMGLAGEVEGVRVRLGRGAWVTPDAADSGSVGLELWYREGEGGAQRFAFADALREDAWATVAELRAQGYGVELLSGDRAPTVAAVAADVGIDDWRAAATPADKVARLEELRAQGKRVLMVGDGLNDAPALAAADASLSPTTAMDVSQTAADAVFQGHRLAPVVETLATARAAARLVRQNINLAFLYNALAVPLALVGLVTPLIAAVAMSGSSILVVSNSFRLQRRRTRPSTPPMREATWMSSST